QPESEERVDARSLDVGLERLEIADLRLAEDLHARRDDAVHVPGQDEARLLDARMRDGTIETGFTGREADARSYARVLEQRARRGRRSVRRERIGRGHLDPSSPRI